MGASGLHPALTTAKHDKKAKVVRTSTLLSPLGLALLVAALNSERATASREAVAFPERRLLHLSLLALTFLSVAWTQGLGTQRGPDWSFAVVLLLILGSHEMGHYLLARHHGVQSTLPFFIPAPFVGFGTLGAVIRIRSRIPDRNALVDIGAAGPLAGLAVALPILCFGLLHSHWVVLPTGVEGASMHQSLVDLIRHRGSVLPESGKGVVALYGDNLLLKGLQRLLCGPTPPGQELEAHPFVMAGWFGMLITSLNLLPVGQLDGGHLTHALWGRWAVPLGRLVTLGMLGLTLFVTATWLPWLLVTTLFVGFRHPPVTDAVPPLSGGRRAICAACLLSLIVCFLPVPIQLIPIP